MERIIKEFKKYKFLSLLFLLLFLFLIVFSRVLSNEKEVIITEVCAHNVSIVSNQAGDYHDYVELYNNTDEVIDLSDYYLSDDSNNLLKFNLEWYTIEPHNYCSIFLSTYDNGFSLSDEETVFLSKVNNKKIDSVYIPTIEDNKSYCLSMHTNSWSVCSPTPRSENVFVDYYDDTINEPTASKEGGFYNDEFYLELSGEGDIYYTFDGSEPTLNSIKYTEPILIYDKSFEDNLYNNIDDITLVSGRYINNNIKTKGTVIRARVIDEKGYYGKELVETYFIDFDNKGSYNKLPSISIITNPDNLFDDDIGIYVKGKVYENVGQYETLDSKFKIQTNYNKKGKGWERDAVIQFFDDNTNVKSNDEIKISLHGNYSRSNVQKNFNIDKNNDNYSYLFNEFVDLDSFVLRGAGSKKKNEDLSSKFTDALNQKIITGLNVATQDARLVQVFINGEYWGVYNLEERINTQYISKKYNVQSDDVVIVKRNKNEEKIISDNEIIDNPFNEVIKFVEDNDLSKEENYEEIKKIIDIDSMIDYYCVELYINNTDWPDNNYCVWKTTNKGNGPFEDGKWRWIVCDTDDSANITSEQKYDANPFTKNIREGNSIDEDLLFSELMKNKEFREEFNTRFLNISEEIFSSYKVNEIIKSYLDGYESSIVESLRKFYENDYSMDEYNIEIEEYKQFFTNRSKYVIYYLFEYEKNR